MAVEPMVCPHCHQDMLIRRPPTPAERRAVHVINDMCGGALALVTRAMALTASGDLRQANHLLGKAMRHIGDAAAENSEAIQAGEEKLPAAAAEVGNTGPDTGPAEAIDLTGGNDNRRQPTCDEEDCLQRAVVRLSWLGTRAPGQNLCYGHLIENAGWRCALENGLIGKAK